MPKNKLDDLLDQKLPTIRKPKGITLSTDLVPTEENALMHKSTNALMHSPTQKPGEMRPAKGYKVRTDIAEAYKVLAAKRKHKLYMEMEEALLKHLREHGFDLPSFP
jgi:hypothetical protein